MGKINRYANIYDTDDNLLRHVNEDGYLEDCTIKELEDLVDRLAEDKDENGNVKDPQALNNTTAILFQQYQKLGNPHEAGILKKTEEANKAKESEQTTEEQAKAKLEELKKSLETERFVERETNYEPDRYIQFEELPDSEEIKEAA